MPKPAYPSQSADMATFLGPDFVIPTSIDIPTRLSAESGLWETTTGWFPFLNVAGDEQIVLDNGPTGWGWGYGFGALGGFGSWREDEPVLDLMCGVLAISSIVVGWPGQSPVSILQPGRDFTLLDRNAPRQGWPYTAIRFHSWSMWSGLVGFAPMDVIVTAKCGYCAELPDIVWNALLGNAAAKMAPQLQMSKTGGLSSFSQGGVTESYPTGTGSIAELAKIWRADYADALSIYQRHTI